jgi:hypothetical protein
MAILAAAGCGSGTVPGSLISYLAQFERYGVHDACLGNWYPPLGSFDGLIVDNSKPNGAWWLYIWYGDIRARWWPLRPPRKVGWTERRPRPIRA